MNSKWYLFYVFPLGVGIANLVLVGTSFRDRMASALSSSRRRERGERNASGEALKEIKDSLSISGVWLLSLFFFFFLGASITAGGMFLFCFFLSLAATCLHLLILLGWMVEYLVNVRHGDVKQMGYVPAGYYGGAFLGRLLLVEPTHRFGERRMIFIYAVLCLGLQLVFWLCVSPLPILRSGCTDLKQCPEYHYRSSSCQFTRFLYGSILCNGLFFQYLHSHM